MKRWRIIIALLVAGCLVTLAGVALAQQAGWIAPLVEEYSRVWKAAYDETAKYDLPPAGREAVADRVLDAHIASSSSAPRIGGPGGAPAQVTGDCGQTITSDGTVSGQWAAGCDSAVSGRGHARYYSFTLTSESDVTITLESSDTDTYLYLRQGDARSGAFLHENDDHNGSIAISEIQEHLDAGTYTIEATTFSTGSTGSFTLTLSRAASGSAGGPRPDRLTVADIDGYTSNFRVEVFVSSIGVNLTMSRRNVFTADGFTVRLDSDENLTARGVGLSVADRYHWSCNPVNGSTGESRHYASDDYDAAAGLPKTDLDNAPLRDSSLGRRVIRMCNGEESTPSRTVRSEWSERSPLP